MTTEYVLKNGEGIYLYSNNDGFDNYLGVIGNACDGEIIVEIENMNRWYNVRYAKPLENISLNLFVDNYAYVNYINNTKYYETKEGICSYEIVED